MSTASKSIISVYRCLPTDPTDPVDNKYLHVQGQIINNKFNGVEYVPCVPTTTPAAISLNVPAFTPDVSGPRPVDCPEDSRYGGMQVPPACGPLNCSTGDCDENPIYTLPSLSVILKNNINCNLAKVDPCNFLSLGEESGTPLYAPQTNCLNAPLSLGCNTPNSSCIGMNGSCTYCYTECGDTTPLTASFEYDGLLSAVYSLGTYRSYSFLPSTKDVLELFICPYKAVESTTGTSSACNSNVLGTAPFCIGGQYPCAYVNLLQFSAASCENDPSCVDPSEPSDPSADSQVFSQLAWVQVKLVTKNKYGHVCIKKPHSLHIENSEKDTLGECYQSYFATSRVCYINSSTDTSCNGGPYPTPCQAWAGCPTNPVTSTTPSVSNGVNVGVALSIVFVNDCVEISQLSAVPSCNVFIVLVPKCPTLPL